MATQFFIFDFDGVIMDSLPLAIESYKQWRQARFPLLPSIKDKDSYSSVFKGDIDTCLYDWLSPRETALFYDYQNDFLKLNLNSANVFPGIIEIIESLPRNNVAILSSNLRESILATLNRLDTSISVDLPIYSKELRLSKRQMFDKLMESLNISITEVYYICDCEMDIIICKSINVQSIAVSYGYGSHETLRSYNPQFLVSSVLELRQLINSIRNEPNPTIFF